MDGLKIYDPFDLFLNNLKQIIPMVFIAIQGPTFSIHSTEQKGLSSNEGPLFVIILL